MWVDNMFVFFFQAKVNVQHVQSKYLENGFPQIIGGGKLYLIDLAEMY